MFIFSEPHSSIISVVLFLFLVIHCLVFLVTTFFCCVPLFLWFLHYISSHFLISYIYFCHWLKNDKLRNITSDVQRLTEISLLATLSHFFSLTCPSLVTNIFNVSLMSHCFIKALQSYVLALQYKRQQKHTHGTQIPNKITTQSIPGQENTTCQIIN